MAAARRWFVVHGKADEDDGEVSHPITRPSVRLRSSVCSTSNILCAGLGISDSCPGLAPGVDSSFSHWSVRGLMPHSMPDPKKPHGQYLTQTGTQDGKVLCINGGRSVGGSYVR